jgi:hypothetical protein
MLSIKRYAITALRVGILLKPEDAFDSPATLDPLGSGKERTN